MTEQATAAAWRAEPIVDWLFHKGRKLPSADRILAALCDQVVAAGLPLDRANVFLTTLHPLYYGFMLAWTPEAGVSRHTAAHDQRASHAATRSPVVAVGAGERLIRRRLEGAAARIDYPILQELRDQGFTDYLATALEFGNGTRHVLSLATRRPGGFTHHDLGELEKLLHIFTMLLENDINQSIARTVLDTYIGPVSGRRVLDGAIARGDGRRLDAVIWFADLRGSTRLSEELSHTDFLDLLNDFFEATAGALLAQGGEVLKFIGDASLGVIPIGDGDPIHQTEAAACARALAAVRDALGRADRVNAARAAAGKLAFRFGIGLHRGEVMFGNIGVPERLDFTVVGAAANQASRVEGMCKQLGRPVIATGCVAQFHSEAWCSLGTHALQGMSHPIELFRLCEPAKSALNIRDN